MVISKGLHSNVKRFDTEIRVQYPYFWQDKSKDHKVTCNNYTTKRNYHKHRIHTIMEEIKRIDESLHSLRSYESTLSELRQSDTKETKHDLETELKLSHDKLTEQLSALNQKFEGNALTLL